MEQVTAPTSANTEATKLARVYLKYFDVDTSKQKRQLDDAIEELLSHLEEFCATLEIVRQHSVACEPFLLKLVDRHKQMQILYRQIDAITDYLNDIMGTLNDIDSEMKELQVSRDQETGSSSNRIKQIFSRIPGLSSVPLPKVSLLNFVTSDTLTPPSKSYQNIEDRGQHQQAPTFSSPETHLNRIKELAAAFVDRTQEMNLKIAKLSGLDRKASANNMEFIDVSLLEVMQ